MPGQLSDDFSETWEDFGRPDLSEWQDTESYDDPGADIGCRFTEHNGELAFHHESGEFEQRHRERKRRERRSIFKSGVAAAERWEREHADLMTIRGMRAVGSHIRRLSEAAAARRSIEAARTSVDGRPIGDESRPCPFVKSGPHSSGGFDPGNTNPSSLHQQVTKMEVSPHLGGMDWLDLTAYGEAGDRYYKLCEDLLKIREQARSGKDADVLAYVGRHPGALHRSGHGSGFNHCPLVWKSRGITYKFGADRRKQDGTVSKLPLIFIDIPGSALLINGEIECLQFVADILEELQIDPTRVAVRRVDVCLDMVGQYRERWKECVDRGAWVTKGSEVSPKYSSGALFTGFQVKGGACSLTVYDKLLEVNKKKPEVKPAMVEHRWHGEEPQEAWRVEFRIRPTKHQGMEFRDLHDLMAGLESICEWACISWFRIIKKRHKNHTERTVIDDLWAEVISGFGAWAEGGKHPAPRVVRSYDPERIMRVGMGCLAKAMALAGLDPSPFGVDESLSDLVCMNLKTGTGQGLLGTTRAEQKEHYHIFLADLQTKVMGLWVQIAHEQRNNKITTFWQEPDKE